MKYTITAKLDNNWKLSADESEYNAISDDSLKKTAKDYIDTLLDSTSDEIKEKIFSKSQISWIANTASKSVFVIGITQSYLENLQEEQKTSGKQSWQAEIIASSQTISSWATGTAAAGTTTTMLGLLGSSTMICLASGLIIGSLAIVAFNNLEIFGDDDKKSAKEVLANLLRANQKSKPVIAKKASFNLGEDSIECTEKEKYFNHELEKSIARYNAISSKPTISLFSEIPKDYYGKEEFIARFFQQSVEYGCINLASNLLLDYEARIDDKSLSSYIGSYKHNGKPDMVTLLLEFGAENSITIVRQAISKGYLEIIKTLLKDNNFQVSFLSDRDIQALVQINDIEIFELLINKNFDLNGKLFYQTNFDNNVNYECYVTLLSLVLHESIDNAYKILELFLEHGADPNIASSERYDYYGNSCYSNRKYYPLEEAVEHDASLVAQTLLEHKAHPQLPCISGHSYTCGLNLLYKATEKKNIFLAELLLKHGANADGDYNDHSSLYTPLELAISSEQYNMLLLILGYRGYSNSVSQISLLKAVYRAAEKNGTKAIELIFTNYDDLKLNGTVGLDHSVDMQNIVITTYLVKHNATDNPIIDPYSNRLINKAIDYNSTALVQALLYDKDIALNLKDQRNPLLQSMKKENFVIFELLLQAGADPNIEIDVYTDDKIICFYTLLGIAMSAKDINAIRLLLEYGAKPNISFKQHDSSCRGLLYPLEMSINQQDFQLAKLLLDHKADPNIATHYPDNNTTELCLLSNTIQLNNLPLTELLLEYHANPNGNGYYIDPITLATGEFYINLPSNRLSHEYKYARMKLHAYNVVKILQYDLIKLLIVYSKKPGLNGINQEFSNEDLLKIIKASAHHDQVDIMDLVFQYYNNLGLDNQDGSCALARSSLFSNGVMFNKLINKGAVATLLNHDHCSKSDSISSLELNYNAVYQLLQHSAHPDIWLPYFLNYKSNIYHDFFYYDAIKAAENNLTSILEIIFQFGGNPQLISTSVIEGLTCETADTKCNQIKYELTMSITSLSYKYSSQTGIDLTTQGVTNGSDVIILNKTGYYWGLQGDDTFKIVTQVIIYNAAVTEELIKHPLIIMDFSKHNSTDKIDLSNFSSIHSYNELSLNEAYIHERVSTSIAIHGIEILALCGTSRDDLSIENFIFYTI